MFFSRFVLMGLLGGALLAPGSSAAGVLVGAGLGAQFYGFSEKDDFGFAGVERDGGGVTLAYQAQLGVAGDKAALYALYVGSGFTSDKPVNGSGEVDKSLSMLGGGFHLYLAPPAAPAVPYLLGGGGLLFHSEDGTYMGRGPAYFGGLGLKLSAPFALEARYFGGMAEENDRSFSLNAFQLMFSLLIK